MVAMPVRRFAAALGNPLTVYHCPQKATGTRLYQHGSGWGFRGYGSAQTTFAIECAIDDLRVLLDIGAFEIVQEHDPAGRLDRIGLERSPGC